MQKRPARIARSKAWAFLSIATVCTALACSNLLDVKAPDAIGTSTLEIPENATLLVNSAIGDFYCAFGSYVAATGLMSGELQETTLTASRWSYDRRDVGSNETAYALNDCQSLGTYTPLSVSRFTNDHAFNLLQSWTDEQVEGRSDLIAKSAVFGGYSRLLLGEAFCAAAIDRGPQLSSNQLFALAVGKFDTAITAAEAAGDDDTKNLALVGRARAKLDGGDNSGAVADATLVPSGFAYQATYDEGTSYRSNRVYSENNGGHGVTVAPAYRGTGDPRVPVVDQDRNAADEQTPLFTQNKYTSASSGIDIGSYTEAQLILAEATGGSGAITILNTLRASASLAPLTSSSDPVVVKADIAQERARWLWLQGTHLYDVRRLSLPLVPAVGNAYTADYTKGGVYGSETCLPIPDVEVNNNPNAHDPPAG